MHLSLNRAPIRPVPAPELSPSPSPKTSAPEAPAVAPDTALPASETPAQNSKNSALKASRLISADKLPTPETDPSLSQHISKLENYFASNGDEEYIFGLPSRSGARVFPSDIPNKHARTLNLLQLNPLKTARLERDLLESIETPLSSSKTASSELFNAFTSTPETKEILTFAVAAQNNFESSVEITPSSLSSLLSAYPIPQDFQGIEQQFLTLVKNVGNKKTVEKYTAAMSAFKHSLYGKRQTYSDALDVLHLEAAEELSSSIPDTPVPAFNTPTLTPNAPASTPETPTRSRKATAALGEKTTALASASTHHQTPEHRHSPERTRTPERLVQDFGYRRINKGDLTGNPSRPCEDNFYYNLNTGTFAVFDAAGGEGINPATASYAAALTLSNTAQNGPLRDLKSLKSFLDSANAAVNKHATGHMTTATVAQILPTPDQQGKMLLYANVGDSRLYLARKLKSGRNAISQLTTDEGEGNLIRNALGHPEYKTSKTNFGTVALEPGDRLLICSDGITGDFEPQFIPDQELADLIMLGSCADASTALCNRAKKIDDRTAIVVEV